MKTFKDLDFRPHEAGHGLHARMDFENGYGVSVVRFKLPFLSFYSSYTNDETEWEVAVFHNGTICYNSGITKDVLGYLKEDDVTEAMRKVQELPAKT